MLRQVEGSCGSSKWVGGELGLAGGGGWGDGKLC